MVRIKNVYLSKEQPGVANGLWLKPVTGGYAAYLIDAGNITALKLVDDNGTASTADDTVQDLIGKDTDKKTANTINGAKAYAKDQADALLGTAEDVATDMTLYGLKAYVDAQIQGTE